MAPDFPKQVGTYGSLGGIALGLAYMLALIASLLVNRGFPLIEPYETLIHVILLLSAPVLVAVWASIYVLSSGGEKVLSLISLAFVVAFSALASVNRYVAISVVRQSIASGTTDGLQWFLPYGWPSVMSAIEMLAWGVFLGFACIALAPMFRGTPLENALSWSLIVTGFLCLLAALGQVVNVGFLKTLGVVAWGPGLVVVLFLLYRWFQLVPTPRSM